MTNEQKILDWYQKEIERDKIEIDNDKKKFIDTIKKVEKENIFEKKIKKINIWQRLMKVLGNT